MSGDTPVERVRSLWRQHRSSDPEEDFDTIGGLIRTRTGPRTPAGEQIALAGLHFVVLHTKGGAVRWFKVSTQGPASNEHCRSTLAPDAPGRRRTHALVGATATSIALVLAGLAQAGAGCLATARRCGGCTFSHRGFIALLQRSPSASSAWLGGATFATAWLVGTFWWLFISMHQYGGLALPTGGTGGAGTGFVLASYYAAAGWFLEICRPKAQSARRQRLFS